VRTISDEAFLEWASGNGLGLDPKYPHSASLQYRDGAEARFWGVPEDPQERPYFLTSLLELMGDWQSCFAWRHRGRWPEADVFEPGRMNDAVEMRLLQGLGMPMGSRDVVVFERGELPTLIALLFTTSVFGFTVNEDLYVVPDHARHVLETDHHDVIHVSFRDANEVGRWIAEMARRGYELPDELPDETFKRPPWMPE
jgi:hypothetical protein